MQGRIRKGKAIDRNKQEDDDDDDDDREANSDAGVSEGEQQQQTGPSKDTQVHESKELRWSTNYRMMYSSSVYAPDMIAPAHPFMVYATGTTPESLGSSAHARHVTDEYENDDKHDDEDDLMPAETDDEAVAVELLAEDSPDGADAHVDAACEDSMWREPPGWAQRDPVATCANTGEAECVGGSA